ncbi:MAG: WecB/TagA/CpsF family glycosyltransferase [Bacilli bacterium]
MKQYFNNLFFEDEEELKKQIIKKIKLQEKMFIVTANPETFMIGKKDNEFNHILLNENVTIVADGIGIIKACKKLKIGIPNKITGIDLTYDLLVIANKNNYKIYLYGASEKVLQKLVKKISNDYVNVDIIGFNHGYDQNDDNVIKKIVKGKPDIILVALGIPKQEKFINKCIKVCNKGIFIGVGGSFDNISGYIKRAPKIFRKLNLEWLYRIITDPKRIKRFYQNNIKFLFNIKK